MPKLVHVWILNSLVGLVVWWAHKNCVGVVVLVAYISHFTDLKVHCYKHAFDVYCLFSVFA